MIGYLLRRVGGLLLTLWLVTIIVFALMKSVPGGPFVFDKQPLPEFALENIRKKYGLDGPVYEQYLRWLNAALHGDFGIPYQSPTETVLGLIKRAWPITLLVGSVTLLVAFGGGIVLGIAAAAHQNSVLDRAITLFASLSMSVPTFVVGIWLIYLLAVRLRVLPTGGWGEPKHLIMPVIAYSLGPMAVVARYTRVSVLDVLRADHVRLARARGVPEGRVMSRYVLRNALVPLITVFGPEVPNILTGSIFVEAVFVIPGLGRFFTTSLVQRDYPMIMALVMLGTLLYGCTYILSDLLYTIVDPRIRVGGGRAEVSAAASIGARDVAASAAWHGGLWRDGARRFGRNRLAVAGLVVVLLLVVAAIFAPVIALTHYDETDLGATLQFPSRAHPLGTDTIGRDLYSRLVYGARTSLLVGFAAAALSIAIGAPLGALAGWRGGWIDTLVLRLVELMTAVPGLLVALLLVALYGGGRLNVILFLGLFGWIGACRLARAQFLALRERDFVTAARALGIPEPRIVVRHVLPNAAGPMLVGFMLAVPAAIFGEAGLSFLGMGVNDPIPSWGKMIGEAASYITLYWYLAVFPTILLAVTILSFNLVGDGLRDALDPYSDR